MEVFLLNPMKTYYSYTSIKATDLAILTGAKVSRNSVGTWMTSQHFGSSSDIGIVNGIGVFERGNIDNTTYLIRPCVRLNEPFLDFLEREMGDEVVLRPHEILFGSYPQWVFSKQKEVQKQFEQGILRPTGKEYTFGSTYPSEAIFPFSTNFITVPEYQGIDNAKYILFPVFNRSSISLSNNRHLRSKQVWLSVDPVCWEIDYFNQLLISKYGLLSGICYDFSNNVTYEQSQVNDYLTTYLKKDLFNSFAEEKESIASFNPVRPVPDRMKYISERLKLLRGAYPEIKDCLDDIINEVYFVQRKVQTDYVKVKR